MKSVAELEVIVNEADEGRDTITSIYDTLTAMEEGEVDRDGAYQQILEAIVYDLMNKPKK